MTQQLERVWWAFLVCSKSSIDTCHLVAGQLRSQVIIHAGLTAAASGISKLPQVLHLWPSPCLAWEGKAWLLLQRQLKPRELCSLKFKASSLLKSLAATSSVCLEAQLKVIKPPSSLFLEKLKWEEISIFPRRVRTTHHLRSKPKQQCSPCDLFLTGSPCP